MDNASFRLPPLPAIRVFEAVVRHLNFTKAAAELGVTQAAVSYEIKLLEDRVGTILSRRLTRKLALTEAGQSLVSPVRDALGGPAEATRRGVVPALYAYATSPGHWFWPIISGEAR
jgi:LysR family transcriptional regulator, glycine cleavage system transcriptional activator